MAEVRHSGTPDRRSGGNPLPEGWCFSQISDVSLKASQRKPDDEESFVYVDIGSINRDLKVIESPQKLLGKEAPSRARKVIKQGDVLVSLTRPNLNAVALVSGELDDQIASTGFEVIHPLLVDSRYIFALTKSKEFVDSISGAVQGALYPAAKSSDVQAYYFPLPPLAEQKVIAEKLDTLLAQVDTTKARLERIPDIIKRFRQSVLAAAVSGKLTEEWRAKERDEVQLINSLPENCKTRRGLPDSVQYPECLEWFTSPHDWEIVSIASLLRKGVIIDLKDGNHGSNHPKSSDFTSKGLPFITAAQMSDTGEVDYDGAPKLTGEPLSKLKVGFSLPGDVIYSHKGTVGRVGLALEESILSPQTTYIRLNEEYVSNKYYALMLRSNFFTSQVDAIKSQTTRDFVPITAHYSLFVIIPPLKEQLQIVRRVEELFAFADIIEQKAAAALERVNNLTQSILAKAFRGELTANWRASNPELISGDNSAEALLAKIQAEREALSSTKKTRKKKETI